MPTVGHIQRFTKRVVSEFRPERIILFGSFSKGRTTKDSDVDLLVVMHHRGPSAIQAAKIRRQIHAGFPLDLLVRAPNTVRRRLKMGDPFLKEIIENGEVLYESRRA